MHPPQNTKLNKAGIICAYADHMVLIHSFLTLAYRWRIQTRLLIPCWNVAPPISSSSNCFTTKCEETNICRGF